MLFCKRALSVPVTAIIFLTLPALLNAESTWRDPHPQRLDGFVEGREFLYNSSSFINRFSYRQLSAQPAPGEDGLSGTGGSITGDELYFEGNLQKTFHFDNNRYSVVGRMQRREDFDGRFDRQLLGIQRRFGENWQAAFVADVSGDKGLVDLQYEANWRPDEQQTLRLALIQVDRLYNNKGNSTNKYERTPTTLFAHYRFAPETGWGGDLAVNYSPRAQYEDSDNGLDIRGDQLRLAGSLDIPVGAALRSEFSFKLEQTDRNYQGLAAALGAGNGDFSRRMHSVSWRLISRSPRQLHGGVQHFSLDEEGWFGENLATTGFHKRDETVLFAGMTVNRRESSWWEPTLYVGQIDFEREFAQRPLDNRDREEWRVRLTLPWRYVVNSEVGAILTLNPTFRLDSFSFGGGNVQLHWPL